MRKKEKKPAENKKMQIILEIRPMKNCSIFRECLIVVNARMRPLLTLE